MTADRADARVLFAQLGRTGLGPTSSTGELLRAVAATTPDVVALAGGPAGIRAQPRAAALAADLGLLLLAGGGGSGGAMLLGRARVQERAVARYAVNAGGGWAAAELALAGFRCTFAVLAPPRLTPRQLVVGGARIAAARADVTSRLRQTLTGANCEPGLPWLLSGPGREIEVFGPNQLRGSGALGVATGPGVQVTALVAAALPASMRLLGVSALQG